MATCDLVAARQRDDIAWVYCPTFWAAVLFAVLFGLSTLSHIAQAIHFRKKFCWVIVMAGIWETAGFSVRAYSAHIFFGLGHFIPQQLLIILAPIWANAFVYMVAGRMIHFLVPEQKVFGVSARRLTLIFVLLDVFAFLVQGSSSSLLSSKNHDTVQIGINICMFYVFYQGPALHFSASALTMVLYADMAGVGVQELFIILFTVLAARFQRRMSQVELIEPIRVPWRRLLYILYAVLGLITVRIIFRLIEYTDGEYTYVARHEAFFYCMEALPMFVSLVLFNVVHPGLVLIGLGSEFPKKIKKSRTEKTKEKKSAERI